MDYEYEYAVKKDINICFLSGTIITEPKFDFFYNSRRLLSKVNFKIETESGYKSSKKNDKEIIDIVAYNETADYVYSVLKSKDDVIIKGFLEKNKVVVDDIQLSEKNKVIKRKGEKT